MGRGPAARPSWNSGKVLLILLHPDFTREADGIISNQVPLLICFCEPRWQGCQFRVKSVPASSASGFGPRTCSSPCIRKLWLSPVLVQSSLAKALVHFEIRAFRSTVVFSLWSSGRWSPLCLYVVIFLPVVRTCCCLKLLTAGLNVGLETWI